MGMTTTAIEKVAIAREALLQALIDGEGVVAAKFAPTVGVSPNSIGRWLRDLGDLVLREDKSAGPGKHIVVYSAANEHALREELESGRAKRLGGKPTDFAGLMDAWGIRLADIELPALRHRLSSQEGAEI